MEPSFEVMRPARWRGGLIVASPHSGRAFPPDFLRRTRLGREALGSSADAWMDELVAGATAAGAVLLTARVSRAVVDLNRGREDLDPLAVEGAPPPPPGSARTLAGLGVIPRVVAHGRPIRERPLPRAEAETLLDAVWQPYHDTLAALMDEAVARFGRAVLIDMHSTPREALAHLAPRPEAVLGDRHGRSAGAWLRVLMRELLEAEGFRVRLNAPFAGAYIAQAHGEPGRGRHVMQLEIDRSLYMDEARGTPHAGFAGVAARLGRVFAALPGEAGAAVAAE